MSNFFPNSQQSSPTAASFERQQKKDKRKNQIIEFLDNVPEVVTAVREAYTKSKNMEQAVLDKTYIQIIKSKNRQSELEVINESDFQEVTGLE